LTSGEQPCSTYASVARCMEYIRSAIYRLYLAPVSLAFGQPQFQTDVLIMNDVYHTANFCSLLRSSLPHHNGCSNPFPTLPHRACQPRQADNVGNIVRRSGSARTGSRKSSSAVVLPPRIHSRRNISLSSVLQRSAEPRVILSPRASPPTHGEAAQLSSDMAREEPSKSSIKIHFDKDDEDRLSELQNRVRQLCRSRAACAATSAA
jgi:hypothetical protein